MYKKIIIIFFFKFFNFEIKIKTSLLINYFMQEPFNFHAYASNDICLL